MTFPFIPGGVACLVCGYRMDSVTGIEGARVPADGSVSICLRCGAVAIFRSTPFGMALRTMSGDEAESVMADPLVLKVTRAVRQRSREHPFDMT